MMSNEVEMVNDRMVFEVGQVEVAAGSSGEVVSPPVSPGKIFYPTGFLIEGDVEDVVVTDVRVGRNSQLYSTACVPASFFTKFASSLDLRFESVAHGNSIKISFQNVGKLPASLRVLVVGRWTTPESLLVVLGLGLTKVAGSLSLNVEPLVPVRPVRLYVPARLLDEVTIDSVRNGPYLDVPEVSRVPDGQLGWENLCGEGHVTLEPEPVVGHRTYLTVVVTNRVGRDLNFCGAVVARPVVEPEPS